MATEIYEAINRHTMGQLIDRLKKSNAVFSNIEALLTLALQERNRLFHSFYRNHNFRRNSDEGRAVMMTDLEAIHETVLRAYKAVMLLSGVDLDELIESGGISTPSGHLRI